MLPTLVYLAREKRPQYHHNYKAGAMNSLVYITSSITFYKQFKYLHISRKIGGVSNSYICMSDIKYVHFEMQLRVSSIISNGKVILNVDCDMYSNNSESIRDALCYFMDEEKGHEIAFVQSPQAFENVTKNDLYASALLAIAEVSYFLYQKSHKLEILVTSYGLIG